MKSISLMVAALSLLSQAGTPGAAQQASSKSPAARPPATSQAFSFLGETPDAVTTRTMLNNSKCEAKGDALKCSDISDPEIAGAPLKWLQLDFNKGHLYSVISGFHPNHFSTILVAFTAKYGTPKIETRKWQAKSGATFDNSVAKWEFKEGFLELKALGPSLDTGEFFFLPSKYAPPPEAPKIDF